MKYIRNSNMEFLEIDDDNLAVYDNESGDTHYIDATGKSILEILELILILLKMPELIVLLSNGDMEMKKTGKMTIF